MFVVQERVQDGYLSIKKVPTATNGADVGTKPVSALQMCKIGILLTMDPTLHCRMMGDLLNRAAAGCAKTERNRQLSELVMFVETGAELSESPGTVKC